MDLPVTIRHHDVTACFPVLDLYAYSGLQPQIEEVRTMYMPDGVHPNDKGNEVIAHKLQKFLEAL